MLEWASKYTNLRLDTANKFLSEVEEESEFVGGQHARNFGSF